MLIRNKLVLTFSIIIISFLTVTSCSKDEPNVIDTDMDGIEDVDDNCPSIPNVDQLDADMDGIGNVCDDDDNDSILNNNDNCITTENQDQLDTDGDGVGDVCDDDDDNDTILDINDNCPLISNLDQTDANNNAIGDSCDNSFTFDTQSCIGGIAGIFPCNDYDLLLNMSLSHFDAISANDSWGWVDPVTNREYALLGLDNGTAFVDITNPNAAIYLGKLATASVNSSWRDIKVYNDFVFIVSEASNHGMQVFDLTKLRNVINPPVKFMSDAHYTGFGNAHNIVINEASGFAYAVGTTTFAGGPHFIDIRDPLNPTAAGGYSADGDSHDAQVISYNGPDTDYLGKEIYVGSNENEIVIVGVSDKNNPLPISSISYTNIGYTHQGWFTENHQYFIAGDELDERNFGINTRTLIFDFTDLDNPTFKSSYAGPTSAIDHNGYVKSNLLYLANYTAGVRFIDITSISNSIFTEIGYFDTFPSHNNATFNGVWNVYPYLNSGNIIISDIERGLFIVRRSNP